MLHDTVPSTGTVDPGTPHPAIALQNPSYRVWLVVIALIIAMIFCGLLKHNLSSIVVRLSPALIPDGLQVSGISAE